MCSTVDECTVPVDLLDLQTSIGNASPACVRESKNISCQYFRLSSFSSSYIFLHLTCVKVALTFELADIGCWLPRQWTQKWYLIQQQTKWVRLKFVHLRYYQVAITRIRPKRGGDQIWLKIDLDGSQVDHARIFPQDRDSVGTSGRAANQLAFRRVLVEQFADRAAVPLVSCKGDLGIGEVEGVAEQFWPPPSGNEPRVFN
mmetsp:Transcript_7045/g.16870  ORF Transcript_7045/g.16870 Transcript_7045/m.16870 type:complete len:201 (+) Transcript_7045:51-653(+)